MTSVKEQSERDKYKMINFEETELRLGLPGNDADCAVKNSNNWCTGGKRGFSDTTTVTVDLKLNLSSSSNNNHSSPDNLKDNNTITTTTAAASVSPPNDPAKPPAKSVSSSFHFSFSFTPEFLSISFATMFSNIIFSLLKLLHPNTA